MNRTLLCFPAQLPLGRAMATALRAEVVEVTWRHFPDGESLIGIAEGASLRDVDVAVVASLHHPDAIALPLRFAAETARELGARSIGLIAPYLGYLRQDIRFHPREALSSRHFADFLQGSFDWIATVDPHLHRVASLAELFAIPACNVAAAPAIAHWIRSNVRDAVVIGPDAESRQWSDEIARLAGVPGLVLQKIRHGDREVEVSLPDAAALSGRAPVLVDDIVSTGHTMVAALDRLRQARLPPAICLATHAVFAEGACERLYAAGAARVFSTDTIPHPTNAIGISTLMAAGVQSVFGATDAGPDSDEARSAGEWFGEDEATL